MGALRCAQAVPAAERETLFADVVMEKDRAEREARKAERKRRMAAFRALLEATPAVKVRRELPWPPCRPGAARGVQERRMLQCPPKRPASCLAGRAYKGTDCSTGSTRQLVLQVGHTAGCSAALCMGPHAGQSARGMTRGMHAGGRAGGHAAAQGIRDLLQGMTRGMHAGMCPQVDTQWRKAAPKLEGEDAYEALDKLDRLEVFQDHILCALDLSYVLGVGVGEENPRHPAFRHPIPPMLCRPAWGDAGRCQRAPSRVAYLCHCSCFPVVALCLQDPPVLASAGCHNPGESPRKGIGSVH